MRNLIKLLCLVLCLCILTGTVYAYIETDMEGIWRNIYWYYDAESRTISLSAAQGNDGTDFWDSLLWSVTNTEIGNDVTSLPDQAFYKFTLIESVTLPASLKSVGTGAFLNCSGLKHAEILCSTDVMGATFADCTSLETVSIEGVIREYDGTFAGCQRLKEIQIPDGAERLYNTFHDCHTLSSVQIPDSVTVIDGGAFLNNYYLTELELPSSLRIIGRLAFSGCCRLEELVIPAGVMEIGSCAFEKNNMVTYPGYGHQPLTGVKVLRFTGNAPGFAEDAFGSNIPEKAAEITCYYPENNKTWTKDVLQNYGGKVTWIPYEAEDPNPELTGKCGENAYWKYEDGTMTISGTGPMEDYTWERRPFWSAYQEKLTSVVVEEGITHISDYAFYGHTALKQVKLPASVVSLGDAAFSECTNLKSVVLPDGLKSIGDGTFAFSGLEELVVPAKVEDCNTGILMGCENLTKLTFLSGKWKEGSQFILSGCTNVKTVIFASDAPQFYSTGLTYVKAEFYYPKNNATWLKVIQSNYDGQITWIGYMPENAEDNLHPVFEDVHKGRFYYDSVTWAYENGITTGISATKFGPLDSCTRAQVVTFLWRAAGCPKPTSTEHPFVDVKEGAFYYEAMLWAVEEGITNGTTENEFNPGGECNRGQVVAFLYRAAGNPAVSVEDSPFEDVEVGRYFANAVAWAVENGITNGVSATQFGPSQVCNRGQIVTFLMRACK